MTWEHGRTASDPKTDDDWAAYTSAGQSREVDPTAIELYRLIGLLWGICADTELFRSDAR